MALDEYNKRSRRIRGAWIGAALVVALVLGWGLMPRPAEVDTAVLDRGNVHEDIVDEGRTRMHDIYVISAPVSGQLLRVDVEPGDRVKAGDILARMTQAAAGFLDTRSDQQARAAVNASEAQLRAAETQLELAGREHQRTRELAAQNLVSAAAVDNSQAQLDAARAARDAARAELQRARSALQPPGRADGSNVLVRAPINGDVLTVAQKSEAVVPVGTPILQLGDPTHIEVVAEFLSQDAVRMRPGQRAQIENWGGPGLPARVDRIEPVAHLKISALGVEEQRTNVILQFDDTEAARRFGHDFRVDARVTVAEAPDALRVPLGALFRDGEQWAVYRVLDGRAELTHVETGIADADYRAVTSGLAAGDVVIMFPAGQISDGKRVKQRTTNPGNNE
ncbi:MAG: efflux RND transporter periplasmic adaptor subunit [Steroidobacteraceae bacterium]